MSFSMGDNNTIHDSEIEPGKDKDGKPADFRMGDGNTISGSAIGNGADKKKKK